MRLHIVQHMAFEGPGTLVQWASEHGHVLSFTHFHAPNPYLPPLDQVDAVIILGGVMSVHEEAEWPWLSTEKEFIRAAIQVQKPVLGICLGAQLVAEALGGEVYPNEVAEIGFYPVTTTDVAKRHPVFQHLPATFFAFHWHGETFTLPKGALPLATSAACANQAFAWGSHVIGLQFHAEISDDLLNQMLANESEDLIPGPYVQSLAHIQTRAAALLPESQLFFSRLLDAWLN
ncbi:type 1 glutamine amidotransferase [Hymenobacter sp. BT730]|uniref:type 1 glutamine amidotransferase n=1 Tax=Hymenobacter sp. BT730 TaxID=3063332 RepID=UPI0026DEBC51|nr:type 1 glutamine amidotransferase [Hymenobacter sp. BT730]